MDGFETKGIPWHACMEWSECKDAGFKISTGGRESVSIMYQDLRNYRDAGVPIPIYGDGHGLVIAPEGIEFLCGYPGDGDSQDVFRKLKGHKNCDPPTGNASCVPGCTHDWGWCDPKDPRTDEGGVCGKDFERGMPPMPWHPRDFATVIDLYNHHGGPSNWAPFLYNEFVVSSKFWNERLPGTIEAIYYKCKGEKGKGQAITLREAFIKHFKLEPWKVPLLCLDIHDWDYPFKVG